MEEKEQENNEQMFSTEEKKIEVEATTEEEQKVEITPEEPQPEPVATDSKIEAPEESAVTPTEEKPAEAAPETNAEHQEEVVTEEQKVEEEVKLEENKEQDLKEEEGKDIATEDQPKKGEEEVDKDQEAKEEVKADDIPPSSEAHPELEKNDDINAEVTPGAAPPNEELNSHDEPLIQDEPTPGEIPTDQVPREETHDEEVKEPNHVENEQDIVPKESTPEENPPNETAGKEEEKEPIHIENEQDSEEKEIEEPEIPREESKGEEEFHQAEGTSASLKALIESLKKKVAETGRLYEDPEFIANDAALYKDSTNIPDYAKDFPIVDWKRPTDIAPNPMVVEEGIRPGDVMQGILGDCWLLGSFCCMATRNQLLENLILYDGLQYGFMIVQIFSNGAWEPIVIDTLLPCNPKDKKLIYAHCQSENEFWVCLLEKAYAKLYGCYEELNGGKMSQAMVDLTGGVGEKFNLKKVLGEAQQPAQAHAQKVAELWRQMKQNYKAGHVMGCSLNEKNNKVDMSPEGIIFNHAYGILSVREIQPNLKLIRIRNPWGKGEWRGSFSDDDDNWDSYKGLREQLGHELKDDGTFWMEFKDWYINYNRLYVAKIFPNSWEQYSIPCAWKGKTNGGPPDLVSIDDKKIDSDDKWFNNPQIRFTITRTVKTMYISLMQSDQKISKMPYVACSFYLFKTKNKFDRLWEPIQENLVEGPDIESGEVIPQRETLKNITLELEEKKKEQNYIIVPNMIDPSMGDRQFWVRIFSSDPLDICLLPETIEVEERAIWRKDLKQGPRILENGAENPHWCENPQFFLNLERPTHVKIVLKRLTGQKKKNLNANMGMIIVKSELEKFKEFSMDQGKKIEKRKKQMTAMREAIKMKKTKNEAVTYVQIEKPTISRLARKLRVNPKDWKERTQYKSPFVAAFYRHWHQTEGPFIIVPSLSKQIDKDVVAGTYSLTVYSSYPVELIKLDEAKHVVISGEWKKITAGGCHLNSDEYSRGSEATWQSNPKYLLVLKGEGKAKVEITLSRPQWKAPKSKPLEKSGTLEVKKSSRKSPDLNEDTGKKAVTIIGTMLGVYIFENRGQKIIKKADSIKDVTFYPKNEITLEEDLECKESGYIIMPCTFEDSQEGPFMISINSDTDFVFKEYGND